MKVLKVLSNVRGKSTYKYEQIQYLRKNGVDIDVYSINSGGMMGYIMSMISLMNLLKNKQYDLIHSHDIASIICIFQKKK